VKSGVFSSKSMFPILALCVILSTALRPAEKYLGSSIWVFVYAAVVFGLLALLRTSFHTRRVLLSKSFVWSVVAIFAAVSAYFYEAADSLKDSMQGQDQDDCTIIVIKQLLVLDFPYDETSYFGNPCSPLFGALVPYIPFVILGAFFAANSVLLLTSTWLGFKLTRPSHEFALTILITLGIPQTLELMVNGSDLVFIGLGVLLLAQLMTKAESNSKLLIWATILAGLLSSSRVSMPILGAAYLIWLFFRHKQRVLPHLAIISLVGLLPSAILFIANPDEFSPLHLVAKSQSLVPGPWYFAMVSATIMGFALGARLAKSNSDAITFLSVAFAPHLLFLSFGDLVFNRQFDYFNWEGASYLMLVTPMFALVIARWLLRSLGDVVSLKKKAVYPI